MDLSSVVELTMAIALDTNPNHGLDNRVHEVVGSAFGGRPYKTQSQHAERDFEPRKMVSERCYGAARVGGEGLDGRRLIVHKWLVRSYEEGQRCDPSSASQRLDQRV